MRILRLESVHKVMEAEKRLKSAYTAESKTLRIVDVYGRFLSRQGRNEEGEGLARLGLRFAAEERTGGSTVGFWQGKLAQTLVGQRRFEEAVAAATEALAVLRAGADPLRELRAGELRKEPSGGREHEGRVETRREEGQRKRPGGEPAGQRVADGDRGVVKNMGEQDKDEG